MTAMARLRDARGVAVPADGASAVIAGDVDGDGDRDAALRGAINDAITWYENTERYGSR